MRCVFALIWDKKYTDKNTGNVYQRVALEMPVEKFAELVIDTLNKKFTIKPKLTRWEVIKKLFGKATFSEAGAPIQLNQTDIAKEITYTAVQSFKDESSWTVAEHGEIS